MIRQPNDSATEVTQAFALVTAGATVLASGYFLVRSLLDPSGLVPGGDTDAAMTYAGYMAARSIALLGGLAWFAMQRAWRPLALLLLLNGVVQALDAVLGAARHQVPQTVGPAIFAVALFASGMALLRAESAANGVHDR